MTSTKYDYNIFALININWFNADTCVALVLLVNVLVYFVFSFLFFIRGAVKDNLFSNYV